MDSFFQGEAGEPLRDVFVKRVLFNMPRINPADYKKSDSIISTHDLELLSPYASPSLPITTVNGKEPPRITIDVPAAKRLKTEQDMDQYGEEPEEYILSNKEDEPLWVEVPTSSSSDKLRQLRKDWDKDPNLCRECADVFCRDETFGDPHLVACSVCKNKFHSFCVADYKSSTGEFFCYSCCDSDRPPKLVPVSHAELYCQLCKQNRTGRWVGPIGNVPGTEPTYVHENCAFYSKGVVKIEDQWCRIQSAIRHSHSTRCSFCDQKGASIACDFAKCRKMFHYACVKKQFCFIIDGPNAPQHLYCAAHFEQALKNLYDGSDSSSIASPPSITSPVSPVTLNPTITSAAASATTPTIYLHTRSKDKNKGKEKDVYSAYTDEEGEEGEDRLVEDEEEREEGENMEGEEVLHLPEAGEDEESEESIIIKLPRLSRDHNFPSVARLAEWDERYNTVRSEGYKKRIQKWESKIRCTYRKLKDITGMSPAVMKELGRIASEMETRFPALTVENQVRLKAGGASY